jgi:N-acetylglutamate synthase-like GNAT family acetyltransferase
LRLLNHSQTNKAMESGYLQRMEAMKAAAAMENPSEEAKDPTDDTVSEPELITSLEDIKAAIRFSYHYNNKDYDHIEEGEDASTGDKMAQEYFEQMKENKCRFFVIKDGKGQLATTGCLQVFDEFDGENNAGYIRDQAVVPKYRGNKNRNLSKEITDARLQAANELGCEHVYAELIETNTRSLISKFKDGFVMSNFHAGDEGPDKGCYVLRKKTDGTDEFDKKDGSLGELQEVSLADIPALHALLEKGWVGIDIKNTGDIKDPDPNKWKLILEKNP